jgi:hypothetical protein
MGLNLQCSSSSHLKLLHTATTSSNQPGECQLRLLYAPILIRKLDEFQRGSRLHTPAREALRKRRWFTRSCSGPASVCVLSLSSSHSACFHNPSAPISAILREAQFGLTQPHPKSHPPQTPQTHQLTTRRHRNPNIPTLHRNAALLPTRPTVGLPFLRRHRR